LPLTFGTDAPFDGHFGADPLNWLNPLVRRVKAERASVSLAEAVNVATELVAEVKVLASDTHDKYVELWRRLERYGRARGVKRVVELSPEVVGAWVNAKTSDGLPASVPTRHHRRAAVRQLFLVLRVYGMADGDPTLDLRLPPRSSLSLRPLDDDEVELCRWASLATLHATRQPSVWALTEGGATSGESSRVGIGGVISESTVMVDGGRGTFPRLITLSPWGALQVGRRLRDLGGADPTTPLVYEGSGSARSRQSSIATAIGTIFRRAGLGRERDLRPESVRAWLGRRVWNDTHDIEAVANRLGLDSLDRAARLIGRDWRDDAR
jgi:hypothetical protein